MPILLREGFGNLADGTHTAGVSREILGEQFVSFGAAFVIHDRADGRKWFAPASSTRVNLLSQAIGAGDEFAITFRVKRSSSAVCTFAQVINASSAEVIALGINASGQLCLGRDGTYGASSNTQVYASTGAVPLNTETLVEFRLLLHGSAGYVKYYINGLFDSEHLSANTTAGSPTPYCQSMRFFYDPRGATSNTVPTGWRIGDIVIHTDASPIGDVGVYYKPVDGDIGTPDFTPSAVGANNPMLDEIGPDEDTTHNESAGTAGHRDQFSAPGLTGMTILEVCSLVRARKTSTGTATLLLGMKENLTEDQSAAKALSEDYLTLIEGWATNPDTLAAWSATQAANALISYEVGA